MSIIHIKEDYTYKYMKNFFITYMNFSGIALVIVIFVLVSGLSSMLLIDAQESETRHSLEIKDYITSITRGDVEFFTVKGIIQNNFTTNMHSINITAIFYDVKNHTIATSVSSAQLKIIRPQQKSPFEINFLLNSSSPPHHCQLSASASKTDQNPIGKFKIMNQTSKRVGECQVVLGTLKNRGSLRAKSVKVVAAFYDSEGNLTAMSHAYPDPVTLDPNEKADFKVRLNLTPGMEPKRVELFVSVRSYEKTAEANWILLTVLVAAAIIYILYMKHRGW